MKVVIVEDESIVAEHLAGILAEIGYEVQGTALSVGEALEEIDRHEPDLVLIDIMLQGERDGIALARILRRSHDLPFLFVTSFADRATIERAKATLPDGYVLKPFNQDDVYAAVEMALAGFADRRGLREMDATDALEGERDEANRAEGGEPLAREGGGLPAGRVRKVQRYIEMHLDDSLTLGRLAAAADMSKYHFSRLFRESVGMPPYRYVLNRRVVRAKQLLWDTDLPIAQIALQTGFSNQSHFGEAFRKLTRESPSEFRKRR